MCYFFRVYFLHWHPSSDKIQGTEKSVAFEDDNLFNECKISYRKNDIQCTIGKESNDKPIKRIEFYMLVFFDEEVSKTCTNSNFFEVFDDVNDISRKELHGSGESDRID